MTMASTPGGADDVFDQFLTARGHTVDHVGWERDGKKKQCPDCSGLHDRSATTCGVCGWTPRK